MTKLSPPVGSRAASPRPSGPSGDSSTADAGQAAAANETVSPAPDEGADWPAAVPASDAPAAAAPLLAPPQALSPNRIALVAQPTPWQRAERLIDEVLFEGTLAQVMRRPTLAFLRLQLIDDLAQLPHPKAKALSSYARLWAEQDAAPVALAATLRALIGHVESSVLPAAIALTEAMGAIRTLLLQRDQLRRTLSQGAALLHQFHFLGQSPPDAQGRVALAQQLLICSISPPEHLTEHWLAEGSSDAMLLFAPSISRLFFPYVQSFLGDTLPEDASPWVVVHWALAVFYIEAKTNAPQDVLTTRRDDLRAWFQELRAQAHPEEAARCAQLLAPIQAQAKPAAWALACALHAHLPRSRLSDLVQEIAWLKPQEYAAFGAIVRQVVPPWATAAEAQPLLNFLMSHLAHMTPARQGAYQRLLRPEHSIADRMAIVRELGAHGADSLDGAEAFMRAHRVPSDLTAQVLGALALGSADHPNLRPAVKAVLQAGLSQPRTMAAIEVLRTAQDASRPARARALIEAAEPGRQEDLESSMRQSRIRASDLIVAQVMDRVPGAVGWRQTLQQIAAYLQAAQVDPKTDALLLDSSRTGVSELDNALQTLQGPRRPDDGTGALIDNPAYAIGTTGRVVGLGHLAAALWQLLRDSPMPAGTPAQLLAERRRVRVDFILALARSIEDTGHRVCGYGLSERLTEACAGYIEGIEQAPPVYPAPLLRAYTLELDRSELRHSRADQETFFHDALKQAELVLSSPEASAAFAEGWLAYMRETFGWPKAENS